MINPENALELPHIESRFTKLLPGDPDPSNERRQVFGAAYSRVDPAPVAAPATVAWSREVASDLGLSREFCESASFAEVMAGNRLLPGMEPYAMCYGGHQFGHWAGQLGDGRAINLGEITGPDGHRRVLQLKGAGPTPYSRTADGRAVLRSSVREFLCSEAMFHLGIPTTRALSLVTTGDDVLRDMFYDGNAALEPGAIVCRVAESFLRFGSYELPPRRDEPELLERLVEFTIAEHFPELGDPATEATRLAWFEEVSRRTADLMVHWMRVGFVHGVMNTDNLSILGQTIDYGPYGWLDSYDPNWTPNTTDAQGRRYRFANQPQVALWNLVQLGNALVPLIDNVDGLQQAVNGFSERFEAGWHAMMAAKLGLDGYRAETDRSLFDDAQELLQAAETDMTLFYRALADVDGDTIIAADRPLPDVLLPSLYAPDATDRNYRELAVAWLRRYQERIAAQELTPPDRRALMNRTNPVFILRNYLAQLAIDEATGGDPTMIHTLLDVMRKPYDEQPEHASWAGRRPDWARNRAGCSMLSCSS